VNLQTTRAALSVLEHGEDFAWLTILSTRGSSPRHSGAGMVVRKDGSSTGTIGGGPLEARAIREALEVLETRQSRLFEFNSRSLGMMCGGDGLVLIELVDASQPDASGFFANLQRLLESGRRGWLVVRAPVAAATAVRRCLVDADGSVSGDPVCNPDKLRALAEKGGTYDRIIAESPADTYVQPVGARGTAYIFGAGHCGEKLVPVLCSVGFATVVVDDRADFASEERFPTADRIVVPDSFADVVAGLPIDENSYIVIVTRGHEHDTEVLAQALHTSAGYIGMIGSRAKVARTYEALLEEGFSSDDLARVCSPIGLAIGAETPEEIAISIAAELVQARAAKATR
jgi:xanthine dehydrogenase accessory factor